MTVFKLKRIFQALLCLVLISSVVGCGGGGGGGGGTDNVPQNPLQSLIIGSWILEQAKLSNGLMGYVAPNSSGVKSILVFSQGNTCLDFNITPQEVSGNFVTPDIAPELSTGTWSLFNNRLTITSGGKSTYGDIIISNDQLTAVADDGYTTIWRRHSNPDSNIAPSVSISTPTENSKFQLGQSLTIAASASDQDGSIAYVAFFANSVLLGIDETAPYSLTWLPSSSGFYQLTVVAWDNKQAKTQSKAVTTNISSDELFDARLILNSSGGSFAKNSVAAALSLIIPVETGKTVNYALTVTNRGSTAQNVQLFPETSLSGSARPEEGLRASLLTAEDAELLQMAAVKGRLEEKLRQNTINALRQSVGKLRASLRASDHSNEVIGGIYPISMVADSMGWSYITRNCKLERITAHCKIFVDQDSFEGLSAITGTYAVTSADLDHFAEEFEAYIYPLLNGNYGLVHDVDNDGRLSILISPVYAKIGFAGLFNSIDMTPGATTNSNQRDLIGVWSPSSTKWRGEYWKAATRETIAHEMQHATNYSAKVYPNGVARTGISNYDSLLEEMWLDESLSVGVEARYRAIRGAAGKTTYYNSQTILDAAANDARFSYWTQTPQSVKVDSFSYSSNAFEHYGQKGLFNFYLFEQYGADKIRSLVQTTKTGLDNFRTVFNENTYGSFTTIVRNWQYAVINEGLRSAPGVNFASIDQKYRYKTTMNIIAHKAVQFDAAYPQAFTSVQPGATAFYAIRQPPTISVSEYKFRIQSTEGQSIEINMMRLP